MPKKNPLDQWGKRSLADQLHRARMEVFSLAQNFNRYFNKTDDFYKEAFDLQRRLLALQEKARKVPRTPEIHPTGQEIMGVSVTSHEKFTRWYIEPFEAIKSVEGGGGAL